MSGTVKVLHIMPSELKNIRIFTMLKKQIFYDFYF
jgi:hypothetical protein